MNVRSVLNSLLHQQGLELNSRKCGIVPQRDTNRNWWSSYFEAFSVNKNACTEENMESVNKKIDETNTKIDKICEYLNISYKQEATEKVPRFVKIKKKG